MRKVFFWTHLCAGSFAGIVILIMSLTGVLLAWHHRIIPWVDRDFRHKPVVGQTRISPEDALTRFTEHSRATPSALTMRSDLAEPIVAEFGSDSVLYMNPWTGEILGEGSRPVRAFFRGAENWHRFLAAGAEWRGAARRVTGGANLLFLGLLLSGIYLWLPKKWTWQHVRPALWFRRGLTGRVREWNWHNTLGIWFVAPLIVVVTSGVVMSYPWANNLVYRMTGTQAPVQNGGGRGGPGDAPGRVELEDIDSLWTRAEAQTPDWKSITMRMPGSARAPVQFQIDSGDGGRPDLRGQLTLNRRTGEVVRWEPFNSNNAGRRLRTWLRFAHTGEAGGLVGETIATLASLAAVLLVWTGVSLALRRLWRARARRATAQAS